MKCSPTGITAGTARWCRRNEAGALIEDEERSLAHTLAMVQNGRVQTLEGDWIKVRADTLCLHGDGAHALAFAPADT